MDLKRRKLHDEKGYALVSPSIQIIPPSSTLSPEVTTSTPPTTCSKGKGQVGKSFWDDPAIALGGTPNVVIDNELRGLLSIPSHELVSCHIHKMVQV